MTIEKARFFMNIRLYGRALGILESLPETPEVLELIQEVTATIAAVNAAQTPEDAQRFALYAQVGKELSQELDSNEAWKRNVEEIVNSVTEEA